MSKLSIAEVRRRLPAGTFFLAEYLGTVNRRIAPDCITRRSVLRQSGQQMVSRVLDGQRQGRESYCTWRRITAREEDGGIVLSQHDGGASEDFLMIRIEEPEIADGQKQ